MPGADRPPPPRYATARIVPWGGGFQVLFSSDREMVESRRFASRKKVYEYNLSFICVYLLVLPMVSGHNPGIWDQRKNLERDSIGGDREQSVDSGFTEGYFLPLCQQ